MQRTIIFTKIAIAILVSVILFIMAYYLLPQFQFQARDKQKSLQTMNLILPAKNLNNFNLIDTNNHNINKQALRGNWSLMFFGYSDCPDICPSTLATLRQVWLGLTEQNLNQALKFYFVSINPDTDNKTKLKNYLSNFHQDFIGVTGTPAQIAEFTKPLGITSWAEQDEAGNTKLAHSSVLLLINPKGQLQGIISPPFDIPKVIADLNIIIS